MKKIFSLLFILLFSTIIHGQTMIRLSQIEPIQGTVIKSQGETANKVLTTNGSGGALWQAPIIYAPLNGSANYIQNQNSSAQTANMWISGNAIFGGVVTSYGNFDLTGKTFFRAGQIQSTLAQGTAPFTIVSTTVNTNLNADLLDGQHGSYYQKAYGAVSLTDAPFGQTKLETPTIANLLHAGDDRFLVTTTGFSAVDTARLFDNNYDQYAAAQINTSNTAATITIDFTAKGEYSSSGGVVYPQGNVYVNFYNNATPDSVKVRYKTKDGGAVFNWSPYYIGTNVSTGGSTKLFKVALGGGGYYCNMIEILIKSGTLSAGTDPANMVAVSEIEYVPARSVDYRVTTYASKSAVNNFHDNAYWKNSLNQTKVTILSETGNVGIGTTSPASTLHVKKDQNATTELIVENVDTGTAALAKLTIRNLAGGNDALSLGVFGTGFTTTGGYLKDGAYLFAENALSGGLSIGARASADLRFYTAGQADANERMRITSGGNILIGTTTDNGVDKLQVNGSVSGTVLKSTVATGTAPLTVASTTVVTNLNADLLDGKHLTDLNTSGTLSNVAYKNAANTFTYNQTISGSSNSLRMIINAGSTAFSTGGGVTEYRREGLTFLQVGVESGIFTGTVPAGGAIMVSGSYPLQIGNGNFRRIRLDASGRVLMGSNTNNMTDDGVNQLQVDGSASINGEVFGKAAQSLTETSGAVAWNYASGSSAVVTIDEPTLITLSNVPDGATGNIAIVQGDSGDDDVTFAHTGLTVKWRNNDKELTDTSGAYDVISFWRAGNILFLTLGSNYINQ